MGVIATFQAFLLNQHTHTDTHRRTPTLTFVHGLRESVRISCRNAFSEERILALPLALIIFQLKFMLYVFFFMFSAIFLIFSWSCFVFFILHYYFFGVSLFFCKLLFQIAHKSKQQGNWKLGTAFRPPFFLRLPLAFCCFQGVSLAIFFKLSVLAAFVQCWATL